MTPLSPAITRAGTLVPWCSHSGRKRFRRCRYSHSPRERGHSTSGPQRKHHPHRKIRFGRRCIGDRCYCSATYIRHTRRVRSVAGGSRSWGRTRQRRNSSRRLRRTPTRRLLLWCTCRSSGSVSAGSSKRMEQCVPRLRSHPQRYRSRRRPTNHSPRSRRCSFPRTSSHRLATGHQPHSHRRSRFHSSSSFHCCRFSLQFPHSRLRCQGFRQSRCHTSTSQTLHHHHTPACPSILPRSRTPLAAPSCTCSRRHPRCRSMSNPKATPAASVQSQSSQHASRHHPSTPDFSSSRSRASIAPPVSP